MTRFDTRRDRLRRLWRKTGADALLVTSFTNVTYLTGFTGDDSALLVTERDAVILSDPRYTTQLESECPDLDLAIRAPGVTMLELLAKEVEKLKIARLAFEASHVSVGFRDELAKKLAKVELVNSTDLVEQLRAVKDKDELVRIRRAAQLARRGFEVIRAALRPEQREREVAAELEYQLRMFGAKGCSFPTIVAVGPQSALPHARAGEARIGDADFVLIDWGANEGLYVSDLTRVVVTGKMSPKLEQVYGLVLTAQQAAVAAIRPGVACQDVDAVARSVIAKAGYDKHFGHGLGHGIGLAVHEAPRLAKNQPSLLAAGMVVTVEPGVYFPEWGGVRIEDDVLVTRDGHEVLTSVPRELADCMLT
jgi:Xaa-Pro aminopeptidase